MVKGDVKKCEVLSMKSSVPKLLELAMNVRSDLYFINPSLGLGIAWGESIIVCFG